MTKLTVAVLTYLRPADLLATLPLLLQQVGELSEESQSGWQADLLVVDNDPEGGARSMIESWGAPQLRYAHEPRPGIAAGRNRALDESAGSDFLVFIDDDERPQDQWLLRLVELQKKSGAVAVAGAVVSEFDGALDPWIVAGGFFKRRRLVTGTRIDVAATNNLLLDLREVRSLNLRFDLKFGLTGAEDTLFTRALAQHGALMVWCNEAVVVDRVPIDRMTRAWVLKRALSSGNAWSLTDLELAGPGFDRLPVRVRGVWRGSTRMAGGAARFVHGMLSRSVSRRARGLRSTARGVGMLLGAFGYRYEEYQRASKKNGTRKGPVKVALVLFAAIGARNGSPVIRRRVSRSHGSGSNGSEQ